MYNVWIRCDRILSFWMSEINIFVFYVNIFVPNWINVCTEMQMKFEAFLVIISICFKFVHFFVRNTIYVYLNVLIRLKVSVQTLGWIFSSTQTQTFFEFNDGMWGLWQFSAMSLWKNIRIFCTNVTNASLLSHHSQVIN